MENLQPSSPLKESKMENLQPSSPLKESNKIVNLPLSSPQKESNKMVSPQKSQVTIINSQSPTSDVENDLYSGDVQPPLWVNIKNNQTRGRLFSSP